MLRIAVPAGASLPEGRLAVVDAMVRLPADAVRLSQRSFTGNDPAKPCAYYELLEQARSTGRELGANLVRIDRHRERTQDQFCDEIEVSFYRLADAGPYEQRFSWSAERRLDWADFKGPVPDDAAPRTAAVTACGIAIETSTTTSKTPGRIYVYNSFETGGSWVRPDQRRPEVLLHEQGHFDLCELYTRIMRQRFRGATLDVNSLQRVVRSIYRSTMQEYTARQQQYERETQHGIVDAEQQRWTELIAAELARTPA